MRSLRSAISIKPITAERKAVPNAARKYTAAVGTNVKKMTMISLKLEKFDERTTHKPIVKVLTYNPMMNKDIEKPCEYYGIIDTGSDITCICDRVINDLLLSDNNEIIYNNDIKGKLIESSIKEIDISIPDLIDSYFTIETGYFKERKVRQGENPICILIGRDILSHCELNYNGPSKLMTIKWIL